MVCPLLPKMKLGIWELTLGISMDLHIVTREGFLRKNIVAVSFFQNFAIHQYS